MTLSPIGLKGEITRVLANGPILLESLPYPSFALPSHLRRLNEAWPHSGSETANLSVNPHTGQFMCQPSGQELRQITVAETM